MNDVRRRRIATESTVCQNETKQQQQKKKNGARTEGRQREICIDLHIEGEVVAAVVVVVVDVVETEEATFCGAL